MRLSIIVPVLDEAAAIAGTLAVLAPYRARGNEVIVVDGGSSDRTVEIARPLVDQVISAPRGRGAQMNAGAGVARGDVLLFLHADTALPTQADRLAIDGLSASGQCWGRFDVTIASAHPLLPLVARMMNLRSRLTGIATGDQAIFVHRQAFEEVGGFPDIALMEDIGLSARLKQMGRPLCLAAKVTTSGRRWEKHGVLRTVLVMWRLRLAYWLGVKPSALARRYGYAPRES
jgi:rSAM/selenodomain-associated transferase 2